MNKNAVHHITNTLTGKAIEEALGVSSHSVRHARTTGSFPAAWYAPLRAMCEEVGIPCPLSAFNWKCRADQAAGANPQKQVAQMGNGARQ